MNIERNDPFQVEENAIPIPARNQPFLPIYINREMVVESSGCNSTKEFGDILNRNIYVALWVDENYYFLHPRETKQKFWIARVEKIIDERKFTIQYYQLENPKNDPFQDTVRWVVWNNTKSKENAEVKEVILYGDLMTKSNHLRKKFLHKIANKIDEDAMINQ